MASQRIEAAVGKWLRSVVKVRSVSRARQRRDGSLSVGIEVNALEFLDLSDSDGSSSLSLEHGTGGLHILSNFYLLLLPGCVVLKKGKQGVKRFSKEGRN